MPDEYNIDRNMFSEDTYFAVAAPRHPYLGLVHGDLGDTRTPVIIPPADALRGAVGMLHSNTYIPYGSLKTAGTVENPGQTLDVVRGLTSHIQQNGTRI